MSIFTLPESIGNALSRTGKIFLSLGYSGNENSITPLLMTLLTDSNHMWFRGGFIVSEFLLSGMVDGCNGMLGQYGSSNRYLANSELMRTLSLKNFEDKPHQVFHDIAALFFIFDLFKTDNSIGNKYPGLMITYILDRSVKKTLPDLYHYVGIDPWFKRITGYDYNEILRETSDLILKYANSDNSNRHSSVTVSACLKQQNHDVSEAQGACELSSTKINDSHLTGSSIFGSLGLDDSSHIMPY